MLPLPLGEGWGEGLSPPDSYLLSPLQGVSVSMTERESAAARLRAAGVAEEAIPGLVERAAALIAGLKELAALDAELPEPALTWEPSGTATDKEAR